MRRRALVGITAITTALAVSTLADLSPPIQVQLRSPWPSAPLLLEILEAAHEEQPSSFFPLLTQLTSPIPSKVAGGWGSASTGFDEASEEKIHSAARQIFDDQGLLLERGQRENFELALALRSQSPKIAAFWQLYETNGLQKRWEEATFGKECESWVDFAGKVICNEQELLEAWEAYDGKEYQ